VSRDHLGPSSDQGAAEEPRGAQIPARLRVPDRLARPARAAVLAAVGLGLALVSIAGSQQPPQALAVAATTTDQTVVQVAESPAASAEVAAATPVASLAVLPVELEAASVAAAPVEVVALAAEEPTASQDEMLRDLGPELSARGGRASEAALLDEQVGLAPEPVTQEMKASVAVQPNPATPRPRLTKAPAARLAKAPTPKPAPQKAAPRPVAKTVSSLGQRVVSIALRYVGYRYRYGGISPSTGFDCSGFVYYVYKAAGHPISRDIYAQYRTGVSVSRSSLRPGDLVFFKNTYKAGLSHASIYIGGGRIVHAQSESTGVTTTSLSTSYWSSRYLGARRP
jgi:cell wall-associated NlpC family hydrolase